MAHKSAGALYVCGACGKPLSMRPQLRKPHSYNTSQTNLWKHTRTTITCEEPPPEVIRNHPHEVGG